MDQVIGVDISKYNNGWNPDLAIKQIDFVVQRVSYGTQYGLYIDQGLANMYSQTLKIPVRGAYHYYSSYIPWKLQADFFINVVKDRDFHFLAIDYESAFNVLNGRTIAELAEMVKYVKFVTGKRVLVYFNTDVYNRCIKYYGYASWAAKQDIWFAQYPWVVNLNLDKGPAIPLGLTWKFWQYGAADVPNTAGVGVGPEWGGGLSGIDLNKWNGTLDELRVWANTTGPTPPPAYYVRNAYLKPRYVPTGPAIIAGSDIPSNTPTHTTIQLDVFTQGYIKALNNFDPKIWAMFEQDNVGPTKGINGNGLMVYIPAGWSGNTVRVVGHENGYAKIFAMYPTDIDTVRFNHKISPHLVHRITTVNKLNQFISVNPSRDAALDPVIGFNGYLYIPQEWVLETATIKVYLNVRKGPGVINSIITTLKPNTEVVITDVVWDIPSGNYWGCISPGNWISLRTGYTDWELR